MSRLDDKSQDLRAIFKERLLSLSIGILSRPKIAPLSDDYLLQFSALSLCRIVM